MLFVRLFQKARRSRFKRLGYALVAVLFASPAFAQEKATSGQATEEMQRELLSNKQLLSSFGHVTQKIQAGVKLPEPRQQSHLLPLLPKNTLFFAAIPNYGTAAQQALEIFRQELKTDAALRDWWSKGEMAANGPKIEDAIEKFYQLHQFLGDEIILSGKRARELDL